MVDVAQLLAQPELALEPVHLPRPDAEVRWVATSELADPAPFLEGGELLLTTGLATKGWRSQWRGYVGRLAEAGVVGLALGVGLTHERVPAGLRRACEEHGLNLVVVPPATTFVAISRAAARLIQAREDAESRLAMEAQRRLTAAATRNEPSVGVVTELARLLDGATFLLAPDGRVVQEPRGPRREQADLDEAREVLARIRPQGLRAASTYGDELVTTLLVPVGLRDRPVGYLGAVMAGRASGVRRSAVTTAVAVLGLVAEQERSDREAGRRVRRTVLELLASGDADAAALLAGAVDAPPVPRRGRVLRAAGPIDALDDALASLERVRVLAAPVDDELWAFCATTRSTRLAGTLAAAGLRVGVGETPLAAGRALARATAAEPVVHWDRLVREGPVGLLDDDVAAAFSASFLAPLDDTQVATLSAFLRHHGSRLKVADELGLHRNTVRNRLDAIASALDRDLDDPDVRVAAWLAVEARR
ncbi:PucR family transcriptional regulator [Nocardioides silvaticus]|uniref:PucR family transcriptional regulator n=1 Tax=Nocardioides silvaticus TaxID=2201891 RepID=A0A316TGE5_9ACTN|nr:PucR family transcriptional regulator [Nocardioides silvaticus]PWN02868.1 PucR family transcriptional regulator [Nocardioides silvaticus]